MKTRSSASLFVKLPVVIWLVFLLAVNTGQYKVVQQSSVAHPSYTWIIETAGVTGNCYDMHVSLALNTEGIPHISYFDSDDSVLMHASKAPSGWSSTVVDNSEIVGRHSSIALDSIGHPHIAYRDMTKNTLKYASWDGAEWDLVVISGIEYGWHSSLAIGSSDLPHIAYLGYDPDAGPQTPKYAYWTGEQWEISVIDGVFAFGGTSLALDTFERAHVSYHAIQTLRYAV